MPAPETIDAVPTTVRARISRRRRLGILLAALAVVAGGVVGLADPLAERAAVDRLVGDRPLEHVLRDALEAADHSRVDALLRAGADPDHRYADGLRPLEVAASRCDRDALRTLERHGAARADTSGADPALRIAIATCDEDTVQAIALTAVEEADSLGVQEALAARGDPRIVAAVRGYVP